MDEARSVMTGGDVMCRHEIVIAVPAYNEERYIAETLQSVADQTHGDFRVLISDNASTDRTAEICAAFAARDKRFQIVVQPTNIGAGRNFEWLLRQSQSTYFMWLGAHDRIEKTFIADAKKALDENPDASLCFCDIQLVDQASNPVRIKSGGAYHLIKGSPGARYRQTYLRGPCEPINNMFRRSALDSVTFPGVLQVDRMILCHVAFKGRFIKLPDPLYVARIWNDRKPGVAARLERILGKGHAGPRRLDSLKEFWLQYKKLDSSLVGRGKFSLLLGAYFTRHFAKDALSRFLLVLGRNPLNT
ncbi:MAG: glycosyltransferase family 2 protein [Hyphomicrobiales bacterium]